jgi:hypothetical protein
MPARKLEIVHKERRIFPLLASLEDFEVVDGGAVDPAVLVQDPQFSLYCFDEARKEAVFVKLPKEVDLTKAPFVYMDQYEYAQHLVSVPYETFLRLAETLTPVEQPILLYTIGRSGSTLLSHVLNETGIVASLSEPDIATQVVHLRQNGEPDETLLPLIRGVMRFLFRPYHGSKTRFALKFRAHGHRVMDLYQAAFPTANNLFLYRDALGWTRSMYRLFRDDDWPESTPTVEWLRLFESMLAADLSHLLTYLEDDRQEISIPELITLWWIVEMEWYLAQVELGMPAIAITYQDLTRTRAETLSAIFDYCNLPADRLQSSLRAFDQDSQAGTPLARANPDEAGKIVLDSAQIHSVLAILARHPVLLEPSYIAPHTHTV